MLFVLNVVGCDTVTLSPNQIFIIMWSVILTEKNFYKKAGHKLCRIMKLYMSFYSSFPALPMDEENEDDEYSNDGSDSEVLSDDPSDESDEESVIIDFLS